MDKTWTLSEAARTGRKFRRRSEPDTWFRLSGKNIVRLGYQNCETLAAINAEMLIATDWEPEPVKIVITAQDLIDCAKCLSKNPITNQRKLSPMEYAHMFIEELGL